MLASYYNPNKKLSQDRISYRYNVGNPPENDLGHGQGVRAGDVSTLLGWAFGINEIAIPPINGAPSTSPKLSNGLMQKSRL